MCDPPGRILDGRLLGPTADAKMDCDPLAGAGSTETGGPIIRLGGLTVEFLISAVVAPGSKSDKAMGATPGAESGKVIAGK